MWQLLLVNVLQGECVACFPPVRLHVQYTAVSELAKYFFFSPFYTGNRPLAHMFQLCCMPWWLSIHPYHPFVP